MERRKRLTPMPPPPTRTGPTRRNPMEDHFKPGQTYRSDDDEHEQTHGHGIPGRGR